MIFINIIIKEVNFIYLFTLKSQMHYVNIIKLFYLELNIYKCIIDILNVMQSFNRTNNYV